MKDASTSCDVLIVGAGMVGASFALALLHDNPHPPRIMLVETSVVGNDAAPAQPGFDIRSTVLSAGTVDWFRTLGLWPALQRAAEPITQIHVSDQGRFGSVRLRAADEGVEALGHVVENTAFGRTLNAALLAAPAPALELCAPATVTTLVPTEQGMRVYLQRAGAPATVDAALVVLAEGGRSGLPAQLGIAHQRHSYRQGAVIANVAFARPHAGIAYERFTPKGPLALLPLPAHEQQPRAALVWTHPLDAAAGVLELDDAVFLARLQHEFGQRLGTFSRVGRRMMFPLELQVAQEQVRPHLALLGNVAHSLHPVAGQGFNLALRDAMALAANVRDSLRMQSSPGSFVRLQAYLQAVQRDQLLTTGFSDYMTRLFSSDNAALALVRKAGMASVDLLPPLKHGLSRQAMGLGQQKAILR